MTPKVVESNDQKKTGSTDGNTGVEKKISSHSLCGNQLAQYKQNGFSKNFPEFLVVGKE